MKEMALEKKLYIPRNIEGKLTPEVFKIIRQLEEKLKKYPSFIGIAPKGSSVGGYGVESSDIDLLVFYDPEYLNLEKNIPETLWSTVVAVCEEFEKEYKKDVSAAPVSINPEKDVNIFRQRRFERGGDDIVFSIVNFARAVSGEKIDNYRKKYRDILHTFSASDQQEIFARALKILSDEDMSRLHRRAERTAESEKIDAHEAYVKQENILGARQKLWRDRIQKFFG